MKSWTLVFYIFCITTYSYANKFDYGFNHYSGHKIQKFKIWGERCSGTTFVMHLMRENFPGASTAKISEYGYKHFLWWEDSYTLDEMKKLNYRKFDCHLEKAENCLFVCLIRNPYDWLRSFFLQPWHVHPRVKQHGFSHFIRSEWALEDQYQLIDGKNPDTNAPFSNVLELRTKKIRNYLAIGEKAPNFIFIPYEDIRAHPKEFIDYVANTFNLKKTKHFIPIKNYKNVPSRYRKKTYFSINEEDMQHINQSLDWDIEALFGYKPKMSL